MSYISKLVQLANSLDSTKPGFVDDCFKVLSELEVDIDLRDFNRHVSQWLALSDVPDQLNVYNNFGQPPVTIFNNGAFVIDLYFWLYSDTSIHTHAFSGAFKVLFGQSTQEVFNIKTQESFLEDVRLNSMTLDQQMVLKQGDCQRIIKGDVFCHRVIHDHSPTITLCIRTINDLTSPQWHQFENGLSIRKVEIPQSIYKSVFYFQYLIEQDYDLAQRFLQKFTSKISASLTMNLFEEVLSGMLPLNEEAAQVLHDHVVAKFTNERWFSLYLEACS